MSRAFLGRGVGNGAVVPRERKTERENTEGEDMEELITAEYLRNFEVKPNCTEIRRFQRLHPQGLAVTEENCLKVAEEGFDLLWFARKAYPELWKTVIRDRVEKVTQTYDRRVHDLVSWYADKSLTYRIQFDKQVKPLEDRYKEERKLGQTADSLEQQIAPLWEEYKKMVDPLQKEFKEHIDLVGAKISRKIAALVWKNISVSRKEEER